MTAKRVAIFGANGGIGNQFVRHYLNHPGVEQVYAFSRNKLSLDDDRLHFIPVDVMTEASIKESLEAIGDNKLDCVVVALGTLHDGERMPEKQLADLSLSNLEEVFQINTFAPALIIKHIKPYLNKAERNVIGLLSARVGSISDNRLGGWYAYRASKAALNMLIKSAAIELGRSHKRSIIIGLHPGTVDTNLSKPFQGRLKEGQLFTPEQSVTQLANVIETVTQEQSGSCLAYDGSVIPA